MHRACSCLIMCVCIWGRKESEGERGRVEVINIFLASSQTSSHYPNVMKSIHQWTRWQINLQLDILTHRYSRWQSASPVKLSYLIGALWQESQWFTRLWTERRQEAGWQSKRPEVKSSIGGRWQPCKGISYPEPKYCPSPAFTKQAT